MKVKPSKNKVTRHIKILSVIHCWPSRAVWRHILPYLTDYKPQLFFLFHRYAANKTKRLKRYLNVNSIHLVNKSRLDLASKLNEGERERETSHWYILFSVIHLHVLIEKQLKTVLIDLCYSNTSEHVGESKRWCHFTMQRDVIVTFYVIMNENFGRRELHSLPCRMCVWYFLQLFSLFILSVFRQT